MREAERLRAEAREVEAMAAVVSYARDKEQLLAKAQELRRRADELENRNAKTGD